MTGPGGLGLDFRDWLATARAGEEFVYQEEHKALVHRAILNHMIARSWRPQNNEHYAIRLSNRLGETLT